MERLVSILKWGTKRNVFRIERSITGLIPPVFLGTKKRRVLKTGDTTALIVFTSVLQTVIAHLHTLSIQIHSYLDDSLIKDFDQQTLVSQTEMVIQLFLNLFFLPVYPPL
jgi:hypothetical protein